MTILEIIRPLLDAEQQKEVEQLLSDYHNLDADKFIKRHENIIFKYFDEEDFIEDSQDENYDVTPLLAVMYLAETKYVLPVDWSGEKEPDQIKNFLYMRLRQHGYFDVELSDDIPKGKLKNNKIERGEWIPLLLNCFDKQIEPLGLKVAQISVGDDEYNIALVSEDWFMQMKNETAEGYYFEVTDTNLWELSIIDIGENKNAVIALLRKRFDISLSDVKKFITDLPILLGKDSEKQLLKLKHEYEQVGCVMRLSICDD
jgi:ribosomal protein L7/L12